jgi:hypothetical protein
MGGFSDGGWQFQILGGVIRLLLECNFYTYINFSCHHLCCFTFAPLFVLDNFAAWNTCLQHPCFKNLCKIAQASKNSDSNAQHFLMDLLTHSWFHSMLFALPGYQFPYIVMNRCFYLMCLHVGLDAIHVTHFSNLPSSLRGCKHLHSIQNIEYTNIFLCHIVYLLEQ